MNNADVIQVAAFNPAIKKYLFLSHIIITVFAIITIPLLPLVLIFSPFFIKKYFDRLHCELTTRTLRFGKGYIFRTEKTIPLDKIQDLTFKEGPLLKFFGLSILHIETAGGSANSTELRLIGIVEADAFKETVLSQRDTVTDLKYREHSPAPADDSISSVLTDIRSSLQNIEHLLKTKSRTD